MPKTVIIFCLLFLSSLALTTRYAELQILWNMWKDLHQKSYSAGEDAARFAIFMENYKFILKFNEEHDTHKVGLNVFADLTLEEFKMQKLGFLQRSQNFHQEALEFDLQGDPPASVDWRKKKAVTPINNEGGQCGSCWVFSVTGVVEGMHAIKLNRLTAFSGQQLIDCDTNGSGCNGGPLDGGLDYAAQYGLEPTNDYPYTGEEGNCKYNAALAVHVNNGHVAVPANNENAFKLAIATMPTAMAVNAADQAFQLYTSGVITDCEGSSADIDHSALAVGYGEISGVEAYFIKNSWGTNWGEHGYVYISTNATANAGAGVCGILSESFYAN